MAVRVISTPTRRKLEMQIERIKDRKPISLEERIKLNKYAQYIPYIAIKLRNALDEKG